MAGISPSSDSAESLSKTSTLAHMNIPQLQRAQKILEGKLKDDNIDDYSKQKIDKMISKYVRAQYLINNYWKKTYNKQPGITNRSRNTITLLEVYKNSNLLKKGTMGGIVKNEGFNGYNALDMFNDVKGVALGIGATAITIGAANKIANLFGTNIPNLLGAALKWLGPVNSSLILGGAALVVAAKVIPAIRRKAHQMRSHKTFAQNLQNELTEEIHNNLPGFDNSLLTAENYPSHRDEIIQKLFDNYKTLGGYYTKLLKDQNSELNNTQRLNLKDALDKAKKKYDAFLRKMSAPVSTPSTPVSTPSTPVSTPSTPVSTPTAPVSTPTAPVSTPTAPVSTPTAPVSTPTAPVSTPTAPVSTPTAPVSTPTVPVSTPTAPVSTPTAPVSTPTAPVSTPTAPVSTPTAPISTPTAPVSTPTAPVSTPTVTMSPALSAFTALFASKIDDIKTKKGPNSLKALFSDVVNDREVLGMKIPNEEAKKEILDFLKAVESYQSGKGKIKKGDAAVSRYMNELLEKAEKGE